MSRVISGSELLDLAAIDAALEQGQATPGLFKSVLAAANNTLFEAFRAGTPTPELVAARSTMMDELLCRLWRHHLDDQPNLALVAVGGYGRAELFPHSDVDLLILYPTDHDLQAATDLQAFLTQLWDLGQDIGHSVRSVEECIRLGREDITIATNLVESRLLSGDAALYRELKEATFSDAILSSADFFRAKLEEQAQRHARFEDSAYKIEPNLKESPGGLRDLHTIAWVAKRHFNAASLEELVEHGFITLDELAELKNAQSYLWQVRFALHMLAGRHEDRLLLNYQKEIAALFGFAGDDATLAVEQFMQFYFRTVLELECLNEMLLQHFEEAILHRHDTLPAQSMSRNFQLVHGYLEARHPRVFEQHPEALLEIFLLLQQHPEVQGVRASTIRLMRSHRHHIDDDFRAAPHNRQAFIELFRQPEGLTNVLRRMHRYGILSAYLPEFGLITGRMQFDLFHTFTVDEHTLFVIRNLRRFSIPRYSHELPLCSTIAARIEKPELLYLAALFHDIAKGRGGAHEELGAVDAERFCRHHWLSGEDTELVSWLVREHLLMSFTAQRKDISDPEVIAEFAERVGSQPRLDHLYLLTVADIRATNVQLWNSWRDALLKELYNGASRYLRNAVPDWKYDIEALQEHVLYILGHGTEKGETLRRRWQTLGNHYFRRYDVQELAWHGQELIKGGNDLPIVALRQNLQRQCTELLLFGRDRPNIFSGVTAILDRSNLNVVGAGIHSSSDGHSLDCFSLLDQDGRMIRDPWQLQSIKTEIHAFLSDPHSTPRFNHRPPSRRLRQFDIPTTLQFEEDRHRNRTVVTLETGDRPGLLARIGHAFFECGIFIQGAKIHTLGEKAEDVFFVTDAEGNAIHDPQALAHLQQRLLHYIESV